MRSPMKTALALPLGVLLLLSFAPLAGPGMLHGSGGVHEGAHVDLVVRKVTVTPARAHVGDVVRVEMEWEYWGDLSNDYYETTRAEVLANGKVVAGRQFTYEFGARLGEVYRETFLWDTTGMAPGKYRIRGEVPLRLDATPYDNYLDVKEPVLLVPAGSALPADEEGGGAAAAKNPFWVER